VVVSSWTDGLVTLSDSGSNHEFAGQCVAGLTGDGHGGVLAIVGGRVLKQRKTDGAWTTLVTAEVDLACCLVCGGTFYVGTDDARVFRVADGGAEPLAGFDRVAGRERWYAGSAIIDGQRVGPPLGVRSMTTTCDGSVLLANVHVGGIPRSTDGGATWQPTIDVDCDVHEVRAHPTRPDIVVAAAAVGLCISRDAGATWEIETQGLHAPYCSAVAFAGDDVLVAASTDHFASQGAVYRRPLDTRRAVAPLGDGAPRWFDGIADTGCVVVNGAAAAVADRGGHLYVSVDGGRTWSLRVEGMPAPSGVLIL
jgi:hypothetical protein